MKYLLKMQNKFKIKDGVIITDNGMTYTTFQKMADLMNLKNWQEGNIFVTGTEVEVVDVRPHPNFKNYIYAVKDKFSTEVIIDQNGLSLNEDYNWRLKF